ncbi:MAG: DEAD/DEAH box helicase family protein [Microthrixaceae bacterium]
MSKPAEEIPGATTVVGRPTRLRLRPWQSQALGKLAATSGRDFLAVATPGAGKTTFALAAVVQHLLDHPGTRVVVVAPTQHLKTQWATAASQVGLHLDHLWSPAEGSLLRHARDRHHLRAGRPVVATAGTARRSGLRGARRDPPRR